jgi:hypothetical protein
LSEDDVVGTTRRTLLRRAAAVSLSMPCASWLTACGDDPVGPARASFLLDISGSSRCARNSDLYLQAFAVVAESVGLHGTGQIWVRFVAADPQTQADYPMPVGPIHPNGTFKNQEVRTKVQQAVNAVRASLQNPPAIASGSALVEGIAAMMTKLGALKKGDMIVMMSDGYQNSPSLNFGRSDTSPQGRQTALDQFDSLGLIPDLTGMTLFFPELFTRTNVNAAPQPGATADCTSYRTSEGRLKRGEEFWRDYAKRTNADLVLGLERLKI